MKNMYWAVVAGMLAATVASSQTKKGSSTLYSADRLIQECRATMVDFDSNKSDIGADGEHWLGYVQGLIATSTMWQVANKKIPNARVPLFCLNAKVTNEVVIRKVPIWAIEHPEDARGSAIEFIVSMLVGSYPCSQ